MPRFVLEIGTEELPPRFFPVVLPQLKADGEEMLRRARLTFRQAKVYGTPRRLALIAEDTAERQAAHTREERGPPASVAFDEDGKPTKAALGFAKRHGIPVEKLERRATEQGEYLFAVIQEPELPAAQALAPLLPALITGLTFPKTMRWGTGNLRFGRPIRWLLALLDDQVVEFELDGMRSGRLSRGHPTLADGIFEVADAKSYEEAVRNRHVIVDPDERLVLIQRALERIGRDLDARVDKMHYWHPAERPIAAMTNDPDRFSGILEQELGIETVLLVEHPTAGSGSFDASLLGIPEEVLVEEMWHIQSYFPVRKTGGKLLSRFVAIRDGGTDHMETIVAGWERVLRAKLIDASFFYEQDKKIPLAQRVDVLRGVVFQEKLGTMYDKMERVQAIAADAARQVGLGRDYAEPLQQAALLCKADLTTQVVAELPGLQGVIGAHYAELNQESAKVCEAIREHHRPRFAGDPIPQTTIGKLLAVCDKLDTVVACFAAGLIPTGSADPYGLRREGTGVVRILTDPATNSHFKGFSVARLADVALDALYQQTELRRPRKDILGDVTDFLRQRLETQLREAGEIRYDLVKAALAAGCDDLSDAAARARALGELAKDAPQFLPTVIAATRPSNILGDFSGGDVDPNLFQHDTERALWDAYLKVKPDAEQQADNGEHEDFFRTLGGLRELIDRFFDDVLVMHEDEAIRRNRLALCWHINQLFRRLADFTLIVQT
jgi:glycyl-tRNA synthetase beta chain